MFLVIYLTNLSLVLLKTIPILSLNTRIFLRDTYIPNRKRSIFIVKNNYGGNFYLQIFNKEITECFICSSRERALLNVYSQCSVFSRIEMYKDNYLGSFKFTNVYVVFLDTNNEFWYFGSVKIFNENSPYSMYVYNSQGFKCFDYFSGHNDMKINLYSYYSYNSTINIQYNSNLKYPANIRLVNKNNSNIIFSSFNEIVNHDVLLDHRYDYTLIYSPPEMNNIHSMFCLSFNISGMNFVNNYTSYYQLIAPRTIYFYSSYQDYWKIPGDSFLTTFNFQFNSSQYTNITLIFYYKNKESKYIYNNSLTKNQNNNYNISIQSRKNETIILELFLRPEILDNDCHNGKYFSINKTIYNIDYQISIFDILPQINKQLIFTLSGSLIIIKKEI